MTDFPTRRHDDWPRRLRDFLLARSAMPFKWGSNDCCMFAADAIQAMAGVDVAAGLRGYRSRRGAEVRLGTAGGVVELADQCLSYEGWKRTAAAFARRGDIVCVETPDGPALAVMDASGRFAVCPGPNGLVAYRPHADAAAWAIG